MHILSDPTASRSEPATEPPSGHSQAGASGVVAVYSDPRIEGLTVMELAGLYEALTSAAEVLGPHTQTPRLCGLPGEEVLVDFEGHVLNLAERVIDVLRTRTPTGEIERWNRSAALLRYDLASGKSMLHIAQTALALAAEDKRH